MTVSPKNLRKTADFMREASGVDPVWLREAADEIDRLQGKIERQDKCFLIVHDLLESTRDDLRLKVENAPPELTQGVNLALYAIRGRQ